MEDDHPQAVGVGDRELLGVQVEPPDHGWRKRATSLLRGLTSWRAHSTGTARYARGQRVQDLGRRPYLFAPCPQVLTEAAAHALTMRTATLTRG